MAIDPSSRRRVLSDIELEQLLAKQKLDRGMFRRMLPLLRPVRSFILGASLFEALLVTSIFLRPWFIRDAIDFGVVADGSGGWSANTQVLMWVTVGLFATWVARFVL